MSKYILISIDHFLYTALKKHTYLYSEKNLPFLCRSLLCRWLMSGSHCGGAQILRHSGSAPENHRYMSDRMWLLFEYDSAAHLT